MMNPAFALPQLREGNARSIGHSTRPYWLQFLEYITLRQSTNQQAVSTALVRRLAIRWYVAQFNALREL
jgi:hypothetical protein